MKMIIKNIERPFKINVSFIDINNWLDEPIECINLFITFFFMF